MGTENKFVPNLKSVYCFKSSLIVKMIYFHIEKSKLPRNPGNLKFRPL